jgi:3-deoxy-D-manno-octulosonic-acid transferase
MNFLYNIAVYITWQVLKIYAVFSKKMRSFVNGRKRTFIEISEKISLEDKVIWMHCASLGEFEQGRPLIENIKSKYPTYKIVLTFFSPSGYEIQKNYSLADAITYLPMDTAKNAKIFLDLVNPKIAIFVKYEFWPNVLRELRNRNITTILVSGIFRTDQIFFKNYGSWMRKSLRTFSHFFVQNEKSKKLLNSIGYTNVSISGDTRFDRVYKITNQDNHLDFIDNFVQDKYILVAGSTWPKDEELLVNYINNFAGDNEKFIIAPHNITEKGIKNLQRSLSKKTTLFSDKNKNKEAQVFIVNTVGILSKIYSYANVVYVGGGFGVGIHNILEPAAYGVPIIIGPNFKKFKEAVDLVNLKACFSITDQKELNEYLYKLLNDNQFREEKIHITKKYITKNIGATEIILSYISKKI